MPAKPQKIKSGTKCCVCNETYSISSSDGPEKCGICSNDCGTTTNRHICCNKCHRNLCDLCCGNFTDAYLRITKGADYKDKMKAEEKKAKKGGAGGTATAGTLGGKAEKKKKKKKGKKGGNKDKKGDDSEKKSKFSVKPRALNALLMVLLIAQEGNSTQKDEEKEEGMLATETTQTTTTVVLDEKTPATNEEDAAKKKRRQERREVRDKKKNLARFLTLKRFCLLPSAPPVLEETSSAAPASPIAVVA